MPSDITTIVAFAAFAALVTSWLALPVRRPGPTADEAPAELERRAA